MMSDYLKRFDAMAKELAETEHVEVVEFMLGPPAPDSVLSRVEELLGAPIASEIRDFYSETNGLKLHWQIKPNVSPGVAEELRAKSKDYYVEIAEYVGAPFAIVNILSLEESLLKSRWEQLEPIASEPGIDFNDKSYTGAEFVTRLKPFDILRDEFCMAFFVEEGSGDPPVLLLTEGWTEWADSRPTNFGSYIEMLLATRGIAEARVKIFSKEGGDGQPIEEETGYWTSKHTPDLFE